MCDLVTKIGQLFVFADIGVSKDGIFGNDNHSQLHDRIIVIFQVQHHKSISYRDVFSSCRFKSTSRVHDRVTCCRACCVRD